MTLYRFSALYRLELAQTLRRPMLWILVIVLFFLTWGFSHGNVTIQSGDAAVGGTKAWVTSEFTFAFLLSFLTLLYCFFVSILSGMSILHDDDQKVGEILHATPLSVAEYVWGKFLAILTGLGIVVALHVAFAMFFNHVPPSAVADEIRGPFDPVNYLRPLLIFALPVVLFVGGVAFYLGERTRRAITVFLFPMALFLIMVFFLWSWSPTWLAPEINRLLMLLDPAGFRWLNETWLKLDLGVEHYNEERIGLDAGFVISRLVLAALGLLGIFLAQRDLAVRLRGQKVKVSAKVRRKAGKAAGETVATEPASARPLRALGMASRPPGLLSGALAVAGTELRNLLFHPGIYLFLVLILVFILGNAMVAVGGWGVELLNTPGQLATSVQGMLAAMVCLLLLFYTVESLERERGSGLSAISYATPIRSASLLLGKSLANSMIGVLAAVAMFIPCAIVLLVQGKVPLSVTPFVLVWGLLLIPTFLLWTSFVTAVQATLAQRYVSYGLGVAVMAAMGYWNFTGKLTWLTNWGLWGDDTLRWSDMGAFEIDAKALLLSRLTAVGLAVFFIALAVRGFARQEADAIGTLSRLRPGSLGRRVLQFAPFLVLPLVTGIWLSLAIFQGFQGEAAEKKAKDYWIQNLGTWKDAPEPALVGVDLDLKLEPEKRHIQSRGRFELLNDRDEPLSRFALTGGPHWQNVKWTVNGRAYEPENRSGLYVFTPEPPLPQGGRVEVGFSFDGHLPQGVTKNGGDVSQFILPSGVVLTGFSPSMAPVVGYQENVGVDEENRYEPKVYPPDFYKARLDPAFTSTSAFKTRIRIDGPADFTFNSIGTLVEQKEEKGRRIVVWQSDYPVRLFNVVGGRWKVKERQGTRIFYHPGHPYNIEEMSEALAAAKKYYSEWFYPFPWRELKISEFPAHDSYAQGFPTNIPFSEGIGFLTKSTLKSNLAFMVTAHEVAHQWWGNILTPGDGPGGNILSEGMSHFSTLLLLEQVKGEGARIEFAKRIEERYGDDRRVDAERPMVEIDGSRGGDNTVTYDKGGWVAWMLLNLMGRDQALAGIRQFILQYKDGPDYPVLQDFLAVLRTHAPDPVAFDAFAKQWYHEVVVPRYRLSEGSKRRVGNAWEVTVAVKNLGTGRMPVEIAATTGDKRFDDTGKLQKDYRDARATVVLGAGEEKRVTLRSPFEPKNVLVDPDAKVLQLRRKSAVIKL